MAKYDKTQTDLWKENIRFAKKKLFSLYPAYIFAFVFCFIVINIVNEHRPVGTIIKNAIMSVGEVGMFSVSGIKAWGSFLNGPTWYISGMIIAMFVLYPLVRVDLKRFSNYIAPIISVFCYAMLFQNQKSLNAVVQWMFFAKTGLLRAFAGISLGIIIFAICSNILSGKVVIKKAGSIAASIIEPCLFVLIIIMMRGKAFASFGKSVDYVVVILIFLLLIISFSQVTCYNKLCNNKVFTVLTKLSLPIYLNHRCWTYFINEYFADASHTKQVLLFISLSLILALISIPMTKLFTIIGRKLKNAFFVCEINENHS